MDLRKRFLVASVSAAAFAGLVAGPALAAEDNSVSEVVVTGVRESLQRAIEIKRQSVNQVDAISAEDIGKLPDKNVADALQRLPGVNTTSAASGEGGFDENDRVSVRGTSPSLTQVTIDGHSVSTGDWFILDQFSTVGRSVSFTLLPSEIVASTSVYKTQDAQMLEGGVAGAVDIVTRQPLSFHNELSFEGSAEAAYNSLSKDTKPQVSGLLAWHNPDSTFGVLAQGFYEQRTLRRYGQETLGYSQIDATGITGQKHPELIGVWAPNLIGSTLFEQERKRYGGDVGVQWRPNDKTELRLTSFYSKLNATNHNDNYMFWGSHEVCNNAPTTFTVQNNTLVAANYPLLSPGGTCGSSTNIIAPNTPTHGIIVDNIVRPNASGESYYVNLDGDFHATDKLLIKGQIGYTRGVGDTPDEPAFEVDALTGVSYAPSGNGFAVTPANINPQSPNGLFNDWAWNETFKSTDSEAYGKVDAVYDWDNGVVKSISGGLRFAQHERKVDGWDRGCSLGADGQCWTSPMPFSAVNPTSYPSGYSAGALDIPGLLIPIAGDPGRIQAVLNGIKDGVHGPISAIVQPLNYYWPGAFKVKERDFAGYLEAHFSGDGWRGNAGVRVVDTRQDSFVNVSDPAHANSNSITSSAYGPYYINKVSHDYLDVLPSVNLTVDLSDKLFLRMSAAETMSRPDFSALGGTVSLTDSILTGNGGNPNLKPIKAAVYDVALEWYYAPTSLAAVSLFYDDLSSYVTFGTSQAVYLNATLSKPNAPPVFSTYNISSPSNTSGEVRGAEFQVQQPLPYNFGFQANYTYLEAKESNGAPLVGASKNTLNLVGYYDDTRLSARLAYTYRSHFLVGLDRSAAQNQDNYGTLDGSISFKINDHFSLTFDALNITDELLKYYALNKSQPRATYENGRQFFFGVRVRY
jgi:iron complex outermembrane receptor protein